MVIHEQVYASGNFHAPPPVFYWHRADADKQSISQIFLRNPISFWPGKLLPGYLGPLSEGFRFASHPPVILVVSATGVGANA